MKNIAIMILAGAFLFSCSSDKNNDNSKSDELSNASFYLGYKFDKGQKHSFLLSTVTSQTQDIKGDTVMLSQSGQTENYRIETEVLNSFDDGNIIKVIIPHIDMTASMNDQTMAYDSDKELSKKEKLQFIDYEALLNSPFKIAFGMNGDISNIIGAESIIEKMITINGISAKLSDEEKKNYAYELAGTALKPLCQQIYRKLPDTTVSVGSEWTISYESQLASFTIMNNAVYKLSEIREVNGDTLLTITATLTAKVSGERRVEQNNSIYVFENPNITGSGTSTFNLSKGITEESETIIRIEMFIKVLTKDEFGKNVEVLRNDLTINKYNTKLLD
ncbi:MAG: hypothetical protein KKA84_11615 [Bacteroidetes bacterium]|nr:hypothetical protein [Bacteroidota bacterium]